MYSFHIYTQIVFCVSSTVAFCLGNLCTGKNIYRINFWSADNYNNPSNAAAMIVIVLSLAASGSALIYYGEPHSYYLTSFPADLSLK